MLGRDVVSGWRRPSRSGNHPPAVVRRLAGIAGAVALVLILAGPERALAADNGAFALEPTPSQGHPRSAVELRIAPGSSERDSVTLTNRTTAPFAFELYTADAFDDTRGAFVLRGARDPRRGVGEWIKLPVTQITVPGHGVVVVPFVVAVPARAAAGDYAGGIVALSKTAVGSGAAGVNLRRGVGVRVYLRVLGVVSPGLGVSDVHYRPARSLSSWFLGTHSGSVSYRVTNSGNVRLAPSAVVRVSGATSTRTGPVQLPELLPGGSTVVTVSVADIRGIGFEHATVTVRAAGVVATGTASAFVAPWALFVIAVLVIGVVVVFIARRRSARRTAIASRAATSDEPDEVGSPTR